MSVSGESDHSDVENGMHAEGPPAKKAKVSTNLYKPPTNEELAQLKETENLFQSSLFRMQINELLAEVLLKDKKKANLLEFCKSLGDVLVGLKSWKEKGITDQEWVTKANLQVPFIQEPFESKGVFHFAPPKSVKVIGSFSLDCCTKPDAHVDLALEIPKEFIKAKDYLNQRYLRKRALYLVALAKKLSNHKLVSDLKFSFHHGNILKPMLIVVPKGKFGKSTIHIHPFPEDGAFKMSRFHVSKNNIRPAWYSGEKSTQEEGEEVGSATPHYNMSVLGDVTLLAQQAALQEALGGAGGTGLRKGLALLKVWLTQRQLNQGTGCFSNLLMAMLVVWLLRQRKLSESMSSYQVMRITLHWLGESDWLGCPPSLAPTPAPPTAPSLADFQQHFPVVFVDVTGFVNLAADVNTYTYKMVVHEARQAISFLETPGCDGFDALFMKPVNFYSKYDQSIVISPLDTSHLSACTEKLHLGGAVMDRGGDAAAAVLPPVLDLLNRAVGRRVRVMAAKLAPTTQWSVSSPPPDHAAAASITVGLVLNPDTASSILERGPTAGGDSAADTQQACEFRAFWGDKCELRRFQDGAICEAVVWPADTAADRRTVAGRIAKYILTRHLPLPGSCVCVVGEQLSPLLRLPRGVGPGAPPQPAAYGTGEGAHAAVTAALDELAQRLRSLRELPLAINSVQGSGPVFRGAEVFPRVPCATDTEGVDVVNGNLVPRPDGPVPTYCPTYRVVCLLEASGKWPDDVRAVQRIKAAYHIQLAAQLAVKCKLTAQAHAGHVDVLIRGLVFRVEVGCLKEISLHRVVTAGDGTVKLVDTDAATTLQRRLVTQPKLTSALHGLHQQQGSFSAAVRLAKRWLNSQLLCAHHVPDEAVELLMAHVYIHPQPYTAPGSPLTGFVRFLHLLGTHDWHAAPLIVNLNNQLNKDELSSIAARFSRDRPTLPWLFVATPDDPHASAWTRRAPAAPLLARLVLLAREAHKVLTGQLAGCRHGTGGKQDFKQIFRPPLAAFDVIIELDPACLARGSLAVDIPKAGGKLRFPSYLASSDQTMEKRPLPVVNFDPVQEYLIDLRAAYDDFALFFHDPLGGTFVAVLWKPAVTDVHAVKTSHLSAMKPQLSEDEPQMEFNMAAAIEDFKLLGQGLVQKVTTSTKNTEA